MSRLPLIGLLAALTPMALYVLSILNPSGLEIAAAVAMTAAVLRVTRDPLGVPRWVWGAFALLGSGGLFVVGATGPYRARARTS